MAYISKITPLGSSTTYDIAAWSLKQQGRLTDANITHETDGSMVHFKSSSSMTANKPMGDGNILHFHWDGNASNSWDAQLYIPDSHSNALQWRGHTNATTWGTGWHTVLDDQNYSTICDTRYVKKAGDTMTGDLTIAKTGEPALIVNNTSDHKAGLIIGSSSKNAGLWDYTNSKWIVYSTAAGAVTLNGNATTSSGLLYSAQKTTAADLNAFHTANQLSACIWSGWSDTDKASASYPGVSNGIILDGGYNSTSFGFQIAIDDDPTGFMALRQKNGNGWQAWKRIPMGDGTGASGSWGISITGNAATATTATYATYPKIVASNEIRLDVSTKPSSAITLCWAWAWSDGSKDAKINRHNFYNGNGALAEIQGSKVYGAVWNDYAEYRKDNPNEIQEPGRCVRELGNGALALTTKRLERGCEIISDTFGFAIGQDEEKGYNTPIASSGRVLAYIYEGREYASTHIGWPVCSGPNGTVSIMTEEEEEKYPSRIIGTISEIPTYEEWGTGNVKVNGRVWIRIK